MLSLLKKQSIKKQLFLLFIALAFLPAILISLISINMLQDKIKKQTIESYSNTIRQISNLLDQHYDIYTITLNEISTNPAFQALFFRPQRKTALEDKMDTNQIFAGMSLSDFVSSSINAKVRGYTYIFENDRKDIPMGTDWTVTRISVSDYYFKMPNFMRNKQITEFILTKEKKPILSMVKDGSIEGFEIEKCPVYIVPAIKGEGEVSQKYIIVIENKQYLKTFYNDNSIINYGTLFFIDKYGQLMHQNHPSSDDYYEYDEKTKSYILNGDDAYPKGEEMNFFDYKNLITDSNIINDKEIRKNILNENFNSDEIYFTNFKSEGKKYLLIAYKSSKTLVTLLFFYPYYHIEKVVYRVGIVILIVLVVILFIVLILTFLINNYFTKPIDQLIVASEEINQGKFDINIDTKDFFGDFIKLGETFNKMTNAIFHYSNRMEELVKERTEELNRSNEELLKANLQLSREYENNKKELLMAQKIQMALIPKAFPHSTKIQFAGKYLPMEALGGDLYDIYKIDENKYGIMILDVCGHGVPAALITAIAKISFSNHSKKDLSPAEIVYEVNNDMYETISGANDYLTCFYGIIDFDKMKLYYSNCAHNEMIILRNKKEIIPMKSNGIMIGIMPDYKFETEYVDIQIGDRIILYTDGIVEASDQNKNFYQYDRLVNMIVSKANLEPADFIKEIFDDINSFKKGFPNNDDIALVVIDII